MQRALLARKLEPGQEPVNPVVRKHTKFHVCAWSLAAATVHITDGRSDDRKPFEAMTAALEGKIFADKGYLFKSLLLRLW